MEHHGTQGVFSASMSMLVFRGLVFVEQIRNRVFFQQMDVDVRPSLYKNMFTCCVIINIYILF